MARRTTYSRKLYSFTQPMRIQARQGSLAERRYYRNSALPGMKWPMPKAIAPGVDPSPLDDLIFLGGKTVPAPAPVTQPKPPATTTVAASKPKPRPKPGGRYHVVQSGEGFAAIAAAEHTTVARIEALNLGVSSNALRVGQKIRVG